MIKKNILLCYNHLTCFKPIKIKMFVDCILSGVTNEKSDCDRMVVGFITTYAISAYHH